MNRRNFLKLAAAPVAALLLPKAKTVEAEGDRSDVCYSTLGSPRHYVWSYGNRVEVQKETAANFDAFVESVAESDPALTWDIVTDLEGDVIAPGTFWCGADPSSPDGDHTAVTLGYTDSDGAWHSISTLPWQPLAADEKHAALINAILNSRPCLTREITIPFPGNRQADALREREQDAGMSEDRGPCPLEVTGE